MNDRIPKAAVAHLKPDTRRWVLATDDEWTLDGHHRRLLVLAGEAFDEARAARRVIAKLGPTFEDRFGQPKVRPEVLVAQAARIGYARLIRELDLDQDTSQESRPPMLHSIRSGRR